MLDLLAGELLGVGDLTDRGELEVADHDLVAPVGRPDPAHHCADAGRNRCGHGHFIGLSVEQSGETTSHSLGMLDPQLPRRSLLVPVGEVPLIRSPNVHRQRPL